MIIHSILMNCTQLDNTLSHLSTWAFEDLSGFVVAMVALSIVSLILLIAGERVIRPGVSVLAGIGGGIATYMASGLFATQWPCETRIATAGFSALAAALLALCILRIGLFILGGASFGIFAHVLYETLPLEGVSPPFVVLGKSAYYYLTILVFSIIGAIVSHFSRSHFLRIGTSILGAAGISLVVHSISSRTNQSLSPLVLLTIIVLGSVAGVLLQRHLAQRRTQAKEKKQRPATLPPVGIPVAVS